MRTINLRFGLAVENVIIRLIAMMELCRQEQLQQLMVVIIGVVIDGDQSWQAAV